MFFNLMRAGVHANQKVRLKTKSKLPILRGSSVAAPGFLSEQSLRLRIWCVWNHFAKTFDGSFSELKRCNQQIVNNKVPTRCGVIMAE